MFSLSLFNIVVSTYCNCSSSIGIIRLKFKTPNNFPFASILEKSILYHLRNVLRKISLNSFSVIITCVSQIIATFSTQACQVYKVSNRTYVSQIFLFYCFFLFIIWLFLIKEYEGNKFIYALLK